MIASAEDLLRELHARGLAQGGPALDATPVSTPAHDRPWYISVLLGVSGWFAGIFLLVFVAILFRPDSSGSALSLGPVLLIAAFGLFMAGRDGAFVSQLALALSIAGQFATLFGVAAGLPKGSHSIAGIAFIALALQLILVFAMPSRLHRTMSTLFACIAWAIFIRFAVWGESGSGRLTDAAPSLQLAISSWMLVWLPLGIALWLLIRREAAWMARGWQALLRPASTGLIVGLAAATLVSQPFESLQWIWGDSNSAAQRWLSLWPLLSALAALGALCAAFALGSRALVGVCVVAALMHLSHFYYLMGTSLLIKSITMLVLGALMLAGAAALKKRGAPA
jgi:hypothetical protein